MSLYKYFSDNSYLDAFLKNGEVYFNSLSYFLLCEDISRQDILEGSNVYQPSGGLVINNLRTQQQFTDSRVLLSKVKNPHRIFVFCTSTECSDVLYGKFNACGMIEIFDVDELTKRITKKLRNPAHNIKNKMLLAGPVNYYNHQSEPQARHACPDQIIMSKLDRFSDEKEYRFAFAKDTNAFDVYNVDYFLANETRIADSIANKKFILGNLLDVARIVIPRK